jgi:hypothetical protein
MQQALHERAQAGAHALKKIASLLRLSLKNGCARYYPDCVGYLPTLPPRTAPQNPMTNLDVNLSGNLLSREEGEPLRAAIERWAEETTATITRKRGTRKIVDREPRLHEKTAAITGFFSITDRLPLEVRPPDVRVWCDALEAGGRNMSAVRAHVGFLSSFFEWLIKASVPELPVSQNPAKVEPMPAVKPVTAANWEERTEALLKRTRSVRSGDTVNFRDFSPADLDEVEELLRYQRNQLASFEDPGDKAACQQLIVSLEEFTARLRKLRIMYLVVAVRALSEVNHRRGERGNWDMIIKEVRAARPSWDVPKGEDFTLKWLDKLDALIIDSLNRRLTHVPRTRLASSPLAREGFIRFPSERIFKATLEALMPGAMLAGSPLRAALEDLRDGNGPAGDRFEGAYVFKSRRGDFEGVIGLPYGTDLALRQALQAMPSLAVKALFALWARLYAESGNPAFGDSVTVSVSQFCDDLGYKRNRGAHEPENRRRALLVLRALMALEAQVTYQPDKGQVLLRGPVLHSSPLSSDIKGYSDAVPPRRPGEFDGARGARAFTYGPGAVYGNPAWRARNTSVALAGEGLLKLEGGNKDKWAVLVGGYVATLAGMNSYRQRPLNQVTVTERTGLTREVERHRQVSRMERKLSDALDRLRQVGFIANWSPILDDEDPSLTNKIEIAWPDELGKRAVERERGRERHKRLARRKRSAGTGAKYVE